MPNLTECVAMARRNENENENPLAAEQIQTLCWLFFFPPPVGRCSFKYQLNISYLPALIESLAGNHRNKILGSISALFVALSAIVSSLISAKLKYEHAGHKCNNKPLTGRRCN